MVFEAFKKALREIHCEPGPNGTLSWGRVGSSFCLIVAAVWVSYVVFRTPSHTIPALDGVIAFILAPYGTNKAITAAQAFSSNPVNKAS